MEALGQADTPTMTSKSPQIEEIGRCLYEAICEQSITATFSVLGFGQALVVLDCSDTILKRNNMAL